MRITAEDARLRTPTLIQGGYAVDDRGAVAFINELNLHGYRRFYTVVNHRQGFVRAWHGHRHEAKAVVVMSGAAIIAAVEIDDWETPSKDLSVFRFTLSGVRPSAVIIPAGFANGFMTLTSESLICFFSSTSVEESVNDDIRFPARYWDPWSVEER